MPWTRAEAQRHPDIEPAEQRAPGTHGGGEDRERNRYLDRLRRRRDHAGAAEGSRGSQELPCENFIAK
jgi:hypothetical protein